MPFRIADAIFWIAVACCSMAQIAILHSVLVSPTRVASDRAGSPAARRVAEVAWAVLPGVALGIVLFFTWRAMHAPAAAAAVFTALGLRP